MADNRTRLFALRGLEAHPFHGGYSSLTALEPIRFCGVVVILAHAKRGSEWLEALGD